MTATWDQKKGFYLFIYFKMKALTSVHVPEIKKNAVRQTNFYLNHLHLNLAGNTLQSYTRSNEANETMVHWLPRWAQTEKCQH